MAANSNFDFVEVFVNDYVKENAFTDTVGVKHPLIRLLNDKPFGLDFEVQNHGRFGTKALVPIELTYEDAEGFDRVGAYTAQTVAPTDSDDVSHAEYFVAFKRDKVKLDAIQQRSILDAAGTVTDRGLKMIQIEVHRMLGGFASAFETDLGNNSVDSKTAVMGVRFPLSVSNTVGNINQGNVTAWQSNLRSVWVSGGAAFSLQFIIDGIDDISYPTFDNDYNIDIVLAAQVTGNRLFSQTVNAVGSQNRVDGNADKANIAHPMVMIEQVPIYKDTAGATGEFLFLNSSSYGWDHDPTPELFQANQSEPGGTVKTNTFTEGGVLVNKAPSFSGVTTGVNIL